jgi:hypothetical protein
MLEFAEALRAAAATSAAPECDCLAVVGRTSCCSRWALGIVVTLLALPDRHRRPPQVASGRSRTSGLVTTHGLGRVTPADDSRLGDRRVGIIARTSPSSFRWRRAPARETGPEALPLADPSRRRSPSQPVAGPVQSPRSHSLTWRRDPKAAWHRALALRTADVQRCADKATGSLERLAVAVNIDSDRARLRPRRRRRGQSPQPLPRRQGPQAHAPRRAREPASFVHVFKLRTTPRP